MRQSMFLILAIALGGILGVSPAVSAKEFKGFTKYEIAGSWQFKDPANGQQRLKFLKDGTYHLDFDGDGRKDIWGIYKVAQDWVIMNDIGGDFVFDCGQQGAYSFKISDDDVLTFRQMGDQCESRTQALSVEWVRVKEYRRIIEPPIMMKI